MLTRSLISLSLLLATAAPTFAAAKEQGTFNDWTVYTSDTGDDRICYALAKPSTKLPGNVTHGDVYFMVANWKSGTAKEQPSFLAGYDLKPASPPKARVGSTKVTLYTAQNEAFVEASSDEVKLIGQMRKGATMRIDAVSQRGTATSYEFSLKGVTAALRKAKSLCS